MARKYAWKDIQSYTNDFHETEYHMRVVYGKYWDCTIQYQHAL